MTQFRTLNPLAQIAGVQGAVSQGQAIRGQRQGNQLREMLMPHQVKRMEQATELQANQLSEEDEAQRLQMLGMLNQAIGGDFEQISPEEQQARYMAGVQAVGQAGFDVSDAPQALTPELLRVVRQVGGAQREQGFNLGTFNPRDYTVESFAEFQRTQDPGVLKRYEGQKVIMVGGVPHEYNPARGGELIPLSDAQRVGQDAGTIDAGKQIAKDSVDAGRAALDQIPTIENTIGMYDRAIELLRSGQAGSGAMERMWPSMKAGSVELDNIRNRLGLSVIQSATFGALSEREMEAAFSTALPTGLDEQELAQWLQDRKTGQQKTLQALSAQARSLLSGEKTIADIAREADERIKAQSQPAAPASGAMSGGLSQRLQELRAKRERGEL